MTVACFHSAKPWKATFVRVQAKHRQKQLLSRYKVTFIQVIDLERQLLSRYKATFIRVPESNDGNFYPGITG